LWREGVKAVPVVNGDRYVVGIITGGDLLARGDLDLRLSLQRAMEPAEIAAQLHKLEQSGKNAADVMTHPVVSVGENVSLADAARVMATQHIKRLPVVDEQERLQGILSRIDLLREIASMGQLAEPSAEAPTVPARLVRDVMIRDMPTVTESAALDEVIAALGESPFRRVAVVDDLGRVVGLISDREMLERVEPHARPTLIAALMQRFRGGMVEAKVEPQIRKGSADEVMISPVVVVTDDTPIVEAIRLTVEREIKRLPVVDGVGHLVGMVDRQSLLRAMVLAESEATPQHVGPTIQ
jgi:CBS domain-containing protein